MAHFNQQNGFMTVSFKMDITTNGSHNGLLITTGIQNGNNTKLQQFGFVQPNMAQNAISGSMMSLPVSHTYII